MFFYNSAFTSISGYKASLTISFSTTLSYHEGNKNDKKIYNSKNTHNIHIFSPHLAQAHVKWFTTVVPEKKI